MYHTDINNSTTPMFAEIKNGSLHIRTSLLDALNLSDISAPRIAAIGAGGKTTTLKRLAAEYAEMGRKPIVTTTTHMFREDSPLFLEDPSLEEILALLEKEGCVFAGGKAGNGKIKILPDAVLDAVFKRPNPILIEADGAKRLPVKFPADYEPVLLPHTTHVLSVYGMDALGGRIAEVCFRPKLISDFLGKSVKDILTTGDIAMLAQSSQAGRKGVKKGMHYIVILNKADTPDRRKKSLEIWERMEHKKDIKVVVTTQNSC